MPFIDHPLQQVWILLRPAAHDPEAGLDPLGPQEVQDLLGVATVRARIEGQRDFASPAVALLVDLGKTRIHVDVSDRWRRRGNCGRYRR